MNSKNQRQDLIDTARRMNELDINQGCAGNLSFRSGENFIITPSGVHYDEMHTDDLVEVSISTGRVIHGGRPSTEWRFHRDILASREDIHVVLHAHPVFSTALACQQREIPAFHYMVAAAGGKRIRCADYALFGTQTLSTYVLKALGDHRACLIANHGLITLGKNLKSALNLAVEVETLAAQYIRVLQMGEPVLLSDTQMDEVIEAFSGYGPS